MIFSLLKIRKKTSAVIAGILIGMACLWGIAMWQDLTISQLFNVFLGSVFFLLGIIALSLMVITAIKLISKLLRTKSTKKEQ